MKKIISIVLIFVYLFNLVGYSLYFEYLIRQNDRQVVQQLDDTEYNEAGLIEIKVPLSLPYPVSWNEYERFDGEIELNGIHYNFVKRKLVNDTLYVVCFPNHVKTELCKARNEFSAKVTDSETSPGSKKGTESSGKKNNIETEYNHQGIQYCFPVLATIKPPGQVFSSPLLSSFIAFPIKPPESNTDLLIF